MVIRQPITVRALDPARDTELVQSFFERASDYIELESGQAPTSETTEDFFSGHAPGTDLARAHKLGVERDNGELTAIIDLGFGFPEKNGAYIGLMLIAPEHRGAGLGRALLGAYQAYCEATGSAPAAFSRS